VKGASSDIPRHRNPKIYAAGSALGKRRLTATLCTGPPAMLLQDHVLQINK
jgi:hypothetical protein